MAALNDLDFADFLGGDINGLQKIMKAYKDEIYLLISEKILDHDNAEKITAACFESLKKEAWDFRRPQAYPRLSI